MNRQLGGVAGVVRYAAIQDAGKAIHPDCVEGQIQCAEGSVSSSAFTFHEGTGLRIALDYATPMA